MEVKEIMGMASAWLVTSGLRILLIVIVVLVALRLVKVLSRRIFNLFLKGEVDGEMRKRADTLGSLLRYLLSVSVILTAFVMILGELGIEIGPILAAAPPVPNSCSRSARAPGPRNRTTILPAI